MGTLAWWFSAINPINLLHLWFGALLVATLTAVAGPIARRAVTWNPDARRPDSVIAALKTPAGCIATTRIVVSTVVFLLVTGLRLSETAFAVATTAIVGIAIVLIAEIGRRAESTTKS